MTRGRPCARRSWARWSPLLALLLACTRGEAEGRGPPSEPVVHTDVATVEKLVSLPGIVAVRWIEEPVVPVDRRALVPGPTDYVLTAYVELDPRVWPALEEKLGGARESAAIRIAESRAALVFPPSVLEQLPRDGDSWVVGTAEYDIRPVRRGTRHGEKARRVGSGLLMSFSTM
jgi:hypothetical protein